MVATAIGAAVGIGSALLSSSAQKKAAKQAAQVATDNTTANNALARWVYDQNRGALNPWQERGNTAGRAYNALLGLGEVPPGQTNSNMPERVDLPMQYGASDLINPYGGQAFRQQGFNEDYGIINGGFDGPGGLPINPILQEQASIPQPQYQTAPAQPDQMAGGVTAPSPYQQAFDNYRNSTGYQFRLNQGVNALGANWAARGLKGSGAALRSVQDYGQNIASNEFGNYMNMLLNQSNMGLSAANAQAGVGTNYAGQVTANNNAGADAAANAALLRGQANSNLFGNIAGVAGNVFGSSFRGFGG